MSFAGNSTGASESDLIVGLKRREPAAMADLYDRYKRLVYSIIYQAVRDQGTAEDLMQETFWRIWNRIQTFESSKGSWSRGLPPSPAIAQWTISVAFAIPSSSLLKP